MHRLIYIRRLIWVVLLLLAACSDGGENPVTSTASSLRPDCDLESGTETGMTDWLGFAPGFARCPSTDGPTAYCGLGGPEWDCPQTSYDQLLCRASLIVIRVRVLEVDEYLVGCSADDYLIPTCQDHTAFSVDVLEVLDGDADLGEATIFANGASTGEEASGIKAGPEPTVTLEPGDEVYLFANHSTDSPLIDFWVQSDTYVFRQTNEGFEFGQGFSLQGSGMVESEEKFRDDVLSRSSRTCP